MEKLKHQNSESPDVGLGAVDVLDESLGRHVDRRPDVDVLELGAGGLCEPEVGDLGLALVDEDVADFDVSVDYSQVGQVQKALEDSSDEGRCFIFPHEFEGFEFGFEVAFAAEFGDDVAVAFAGEDFVALEDVGVVYFFEDVDF